MVDSNDNNTQIVKHCPFKVCEINFTCRTLQPKLESIGFTRCLIYLCTIPLCNNIVTTEATTEGWLSFAVKKTL